MTTAKRKRAHRNTCGATCSTDWVAALREANRHIEALAVVRKDNAWDMLCARTARNKIIAQMSNDEAHGRAVARTVQPLVGCWGLT